MDEDDDIYADTVKWQKPNIQSKNSPFGSFTHHPKPLVISSLSHQTSITDSRRAFVEEVDDEEDEVYPHVGQLKNPNAILELSDGSKDEIEYNRPLQSNPSNDGDDSEDKEASEEEKLQEETDEQELGNLF